MRYTAKQSTVNPRYFDVFNPVGDPVWTLWDEDWMIVSMMYDTAIKRHGEREANSLMFGYLLGMAHYSMHSEHYPLSRTLVDTDTRREVQVDFPKDHPARSALDARKVAMGPHASAGIDTPPIL